MSQEQLSEAMREFDRIAEQIQTNQQTRSKLLTQQNENQSVLKEMERLTEDAVIYKVVGPILVRQSRSDSQTVVSKRLSYVNDELQRCEKIESELNSKAQESAKKVEHLQKKILEKQKQQRGRI